MSNLPCENCIVVSMCRNRVYEYNFVDFIRQCTILEKYVFSSGNWTVSEKYSKASCFLYIKENSK